MEVGQVIVVDGEAVKEGFAVDGVAEIGYLIEDLGHYSIGIVLGTVIGFQQLLIVEGCYFEELLLVLH